jgi:hypothetical protein
MVNPEYNVLKDWMFGKLNTFLDNIEPNPEYLNLKMSIGEPTLKIPETVKVLILGKYPANVALASGIIKAISSPIPTFSFLL